jgi:dephospho-CoA kinase
MPLFKDKFVVGLTGGIGSGKTTVSNLFYDRGINIVDADVVAREVVKIGTVGLAKVVKRFSENVLQTDGNLDRAKLREIAFADNKAKNDLNAILHPLIRDEMMSQINNSQSQYCILSAPLLFENKLHEWTDRSAVVDIPPNLQKSRTLQRDGGNEKTIDAIIKAQISRENRLLLADDIIDNSQGKEALVGQVDNLHHQYVELSQNGEIKQ